MPINTNPPSSVSFDFFFPCSGSSAANALVRPPRITFDEKPWVQEASTWVVDDRKPPGFIDIYVRAGNHKEAYRVHVRTTFGCIKSRFAYDLRSEVLDRQKMSPSALTLYFDGKKLPDDGTVRQYEVEEDDIIDCFRDPRQWDLSG